jgi:hypothetical protein
MILIEKPYVSEFLIRTLERNQFPVIHTETSAELLQNRAINFLLEEKAIEMFKTDDHVMLYSNSENSISWVEEHLKFTALPDQIKCCKNKFLFRNLLRDMYPGFFYISVPFDKIESLAYKNFTFPLIIKPAVGFFSLGVNKVENPESWPETLQNIKIENQRIESLYPPEVLNTHEFIIEECIHGKEFAVDCYFNQKGDPVILNVLNHLFAGSNDVNDRVYITSIEIIETFSEPIKSFLAETGRRMKLRNFPVHVEVRIDEHNKVRPIEFNPMRFGGWCSTPDLAWHAWGMNAYEYLFEQKEPDWKQLFRGKADLIYSNIVLNNSTGKPGKEILSFDYDKLLSEFNKPLELRKTDFRKFPLFGFLFTETHVSNHQELMRILNSDLKIYIR